MLLTNGYLLVEEDSCDLILMDVNLPGENGFILCRKLRQSSNVPVIFLTARDTPEEGRGRVPVWGFTKEVFRRNYLLPAIDLNLIRMTISDKPNSRNQRYVRE